MIRLSCIDTSTLTGGRGSVRLPIVPRGSHLTIKVGNQPPLVGTSGFSTEYMLCLQKGTGLALHTALTAEAASRSHPVEVTVTVG